jgi:glycerate kinase
MRVLVAPDSFKGTFTAAEVAEALARGVRRAGHDADCCPIADGGEGTAAALAATGGTWHNARVTGPIGKPVHAAWAMLPGRTTAAIDLAAAAGLTLVPEPRRSPLRTTSFGVGELVRAALDAGATRILLGLGGSATIDGGAGAAQALGVAFFDVRDHPIHRPMTGGLLAEATRIDTAGLDPRLADIELLLLRDVDHVLCGPAGAAAVFGPQKGATDAHVVQLDDALNQWADMVQATAPPQTGPLAQSPGMGAAGGFAVAGVGLLGGRLVPGGAAVLEAVNFHQRLQTADLVLTGEGCLDGQTLGGKAVAAVAQAAKAAHVRAVAVCGRARVGDDAARMLRERGLTAWHQAAADDTTATLDHLAAAAEQATR